MTSLILVLALFQPCFGQESSKAPIITAPSISDQNRIDAIDQSFQGLQSGKPHFTSTPTFSAITFGDGTTQTTAASGGGVTASQTWVFLSSQDSTNSSRMQFDSSWFVFSATTQYRFDYYGVMASSTSNLFANINCITNGSENYSWRHGGSIDAAATNAYEGDSSAGANGKSFSLNNQVANTQHISNSGWIQGSVTYEAVADTMTVREIPGGGETHDCESSGSCSEMFQGGKFSGLGKGWSSTCFDTSSGFYNANIDRTRAWSWLHVDVWKGPKVGQ